LVAEQIDGEFGDCLIDLSRRIHTHPETAFEERHAAAAIAAFLAERGAGRGYGRAQALQAVGCRSAAPAPVGRPRQKRGFKDVDDSLQPVRVDHSEALPPPI
jgi:hypothetical protein